jgi:3-hexulose-6-phosphate synthase
MTANRKTQLQIALDTRSLAEAVKLAEIIQNQVDIIEVGTPLIKRYGVESIRTIKQTCPAHPVVADMKTMDGGTYEAELAFDYGADVTVVMAVADQATIHKVLEVARERGKRVMVDMLGRCDVESYLESVSQLADDLILLVHSAFDREQREKEERLLGDLRRARMNTNHLLAVGGGINPETLRLVKSHDPDIVVVGSFVVSALDPVQAITELRGVLL